MLRAEIPTNRPEPEKFVSSELESPQYLVRVYRDSHGTTRTVCTRATAADVWGPEYLLLTDFTS
jgi:hypothetical protein